MDPFPAFAVTLALITIVSLRYRVSPFFTLVGGAILFGLLAGMTPDATMQQVVAGAGAVFSAFGIIIFCGAVIAAILQEQDQAAEIVSDLRRLVRNRTALAGFSGWFLAVPITCCVTAYVMLVPILNCLGGDSRRKAALLYPAAVGSILSYILVYPTPATIPLFSAFSAGTGALAYDAVAVPLSLLVLAGAVLAYGRLFPPAAGDGEPSASCPAPLPLPAGPAGHGGIHWRAWGPFIAILAAIPVSYLLFGLSHAGIMNVIMLAGAVTAIALAPADARQRGVTGGAKHAGLIIFDICGAGALGFVIVQSGFAGQALLTMTQLMPVVVVPFMIAALIATAQGSRVTTAVITSEVLAGSVVAGAIHPVVLILLVGAGSCIVSYVTDPFFWLVQRTTGDDVGTVVKYYTLPLALAGIAVFIAAVALQYLVFR